MPTMERVYEIDKNAALESARRVTPETTGERIVMRNVLAALESNKQIVVVYTSEEGITTTRYIEISTVSRTKAKKLTIKGFDSRREGFRTFRADRISQIGLA